MRSTLPSLFLALAAAVSLAACSGGKNSSSSTTTTTTTTQSSPAAAPAGSPAAGATAAGSPAAPVAGTSPAAGASPAMSAQRMARGSPEPIPASVNCPGGQAPVWTNSRTHAYHVASDPMYGRTKHGKYMCLRDAVNAGYHAAGARHHNGGAMQAQPSASPAM